KAVLILVGGVRAVDQTVAVVIDLIGAVFALPWRSAGIQIVAIAIVGAIPVAVSIIARAHVHALTALVGELEAARVSHDDVSGQRTDLDGPLEYLAVDELNRSRQAAKANRSIRSHRE